MTGDTFESAPLDDATRREIRGNRLANTLTGPGAGRTDGHRAGAVPPRDDWWRTLVRSAGVVAVAAAALIATASYCAALVYPGEASSSVRSVEWLRDHGGGGLVDSVENWWYTRHPPPTSPAGALRRPRPASRPGVVDAPGVGEGRWVGWPAVAGGPTPMSTMWLRPDPAHPGVVVAVARFDQRLVTARLIAGTREPDGRTWSEGGQVPSEQRPALVATFNSGFRMSGAHGGFYADGRLARPLRDGAASLVIDDNGRISVDEWGRDRRFGPHIAAVRQNLALIVDHGVPEPGLDANHGGRWGSAKNQLQYTWRSALGVDAAGNLYYVAGDQLTLRTLAGALAATGAVRGMELDIHPAEVHLFAYRPGPVGTQLPEKLLGSMVGPVARYLAPDQRDFIALTRRPGAGARRSG
jgi:hypothetical protein